MNKTQTDERSVIFEVIPGGAMNTTFDPTGLKPSFEVVEGLACCTDDDIPCPDKPFEEWTEEERDEYYRLIWEIAGPGTLEHAMKTIDVAPQIVRTVLDFMELYRRTWNTQAEESGLTGEWKDLNGDYLIVLLKRRLSVNGSEL